MGNKFYLAVVLVVGVALGCSKHSNRDINATTGSGSGTPADPPKEPASKPPGSGDSYALDPIIVGPKIDINSPTLQSWLQAYLYPPLELAPMPHTPTPR